MATDREQPRRFYARPVDRSFEAFRDFVDYMTSSLGGEHDMSEDELRQAWRDFWASADPTESPGPLR